MKDKKRKYILMIILLGVLMLLSGCVRKECEEKVKDLEFTVTKEEELPEALRQQIEEKKEGELGPGYPTPQSSPLRPSRR